MLLWRKLHKMQSTVYLTNSNDLEGKFSQWFNSLSQKTLNETDFLSVSILNTCIEMSQLHKLLLFKYLSMWHEFSPYFPSIYYRFSPWHTHFSVLKINTASLDILFLCFCSLLYWCRVKVLLWWKGNTTKKTMHSSCSSCNT